MNTLIWTHETHTEAQAHYRDLLAHGCKARMFLAYSGNGWTVTVPGDA